MSKRVVIADDSMLMRKIVADCLVDGGWTVVGEATDGQEAAEMFALYRPDVCTLDIVMPGFDGLYALKKIIEMEPSAKVIMVSALNQTQKVTESIRQGASDFIGKPFLPETLVETAARCAAATPLTAN